MIRTQTGDYCHVTRDEIDPMIGVSDNESVISITAIYPGANAKVVSVSLVDPKLAKSHVTAARLCGGTSTCLALHEV